MVLEHWLEVKRSKQREINLNSYTISHVAAFVYNYLKSENAQSLESKDFLPFREDSGESYVSKKTAKIFVWASKEGMIPPNILADFNAVENGKLIQNILELGS